jgi:tetratricopeptide (TPR) repeat protein
MPEKKKISQKDARRPVTKMPPPKTSKTAQPSESAPAGAAKALESVRTTAAGGRAAAAAVPAPTSEGPRQLGSFESAMKLFHARKLKEARELFAKAAEGPERDVANRARLHMAMCDRRLQAVTVNLGSAEDYYNYGIALINSRNIAEARGHLEKALEMAPESDHIHYALALAQALGGDLASAHANLKRAIELEPRNRSIARQDADFAHIANQPPFDSLIYPEKKGW